MNKSIMSNIVITVRGKVVRMPQENRAMLSSIISSNPFCLITGEKDGRKYRFQLLSTGARWVEAK